MEMAVPMDENTVKTMMAPQAATCVAFGMLVSDGLIAPGSVLTDSKRRWKATVRVDGSLDCDGQPAGRSEEHTSELQSLMRNSYAVFCLKKKKIDQPFTSETNTITSLYSSRT